MSVRRCQSDSYCTGCPRSQCSPQYSPLSHQLNKSTTIEIRPHKHQTYASNVLGTQPRTTLLPNVADPPRWLINRRVWAARVQIPRLRGTTSNPSPNFLTCRLMLHTLRRLCPRGFQFHLTVGSTVQTSLGDNTVRQRTTARSGYEAKRERYAAEESRAAVTLCFLGVWGALRRRHRRKKKKKKKKQQQQQFSCRR